MKGLCLVMIDRKEGMREREEPWPWRIVSESKIRQGWPEMKWNKKIKRGWVQVQCPLKVYTLFSFQLRGKERGGGGVYQTSRMTDELAHPHTHIEVAHSHCYFISWYPSYTRPLPMLLLFFTALWVSRSDEGRERSRERERERVALIYFTICFVWCCYVQLL